MNKTKQELFQDFLKYEGPDVSGRTCDSRVISLKKEKELARFFPPEWDEKDASMFLYYLLIEYGKDLAMKKRYE